MNWIRRTLLKKSTLGADSKEKEYVAIYDFAPTSDDDLAFNKGETFVILDDSVQHWWKARCLENSREGYVPKNYIEELNKDAPDEKLEKAHLHARPVIRSSSDVDLRSEKPKKPWQLFARFRVKDDNDVPEPLPRPPKSVNSRIEIPEIRTPEENATFIGNDDSYAPPPPPPLPPRPPKSNNLKVSTPELRTPDETVEGNSTFFTGSIPVISKSENDSKSWFFGRLEVEECKRLLLGKENRNGTFMVREETNNPGVYNLSVLCDKEVHHYAIETHRSCDYFYHNIDILFRTIDHLVQYYSAVLDDLCCKLTDSCPDVRNDRWKISRNSVTLGAKLGNGSFGEVVKGMWNGNHVAVKKIKKSDLRSKEEFFKEAELMKELRHHNIVSLYGVVYDDPVWIVTEFMCNGDLLKYLRRGRWENSSLAELVDFSAQISNGMAYMEEKEYIHRDLRAANILVGDVCKIADFGLARILDEGIYVSSSQVFPVKWTAPEALEYKEFSVKSDVWSFGILLHEIFSVGAEPYPGLDNKSVFSQITRNYRMNQHKNCPDMIYSKMCECWSADAEQRPTFASLNLFLERFDVSTDRPCENE